mmetsp:Transcript_49742/g.100105  ORF Transcript_49742/g.100105 Transcript_49742/m.100105 type:complete len:252 (-) Transcript_49742:900-1655(-)
MEYTALMQGLGRMWPAANRGWARGSERIKQASASRSPFSSSFSSSVLNLFPAELAPRPTPPGSGQKMAERGAYMSKTKGSSLRPHTCRCSSIIIMRIKFASSRAISDDAKAPELSGGGAEGPSVTRRPQLSTPAAWRTIAIIGSPTIKLTRLEARMDPLGPSACEARKAAREMRQDRSCTTTTEGAVSRSSEAVKIKISNCSQTVCSSYLSWSFVSTITVCPPFFATSLHRFMFSKVSSNRLSGCIPFSDK